MTNAKLTNTARRLITCAALALAAPIASPQAVNPAAGYPSKPIRMVAPISPGGGLDIFTRALAQKMSERMG